VELNQKIFQCIIIDDDEIDRLTTQSFCRHYPFLKIAGSFESAEKALPVIKQSPPDVLLLDIDMPG
jgi:two-component system, LytTR family, response regulator